MQITVNGLFSTAKARRWVMAWGIAEFKGYILQSLSEKKQG